jgi:hypothetical protein
MKKNGAWKRARKTTVYHAWASIGCHHNTWIEASIDTQQRKDCKGPQRFISLEDHKG